MNFFKSNTVKPLKKSSKLSRNHANIFDLRPFIGIGEIQNEETSLTSIKKTLGEPVTDICDDRGNRVIVYPKAGLSFKFLKILNEGAIDPQVSFISVKSPFKTSDEDSIYPGLEKREVHLRMFGNEPADFKNNEEIWKNDNDKRMKFIYDKQNVLETIIIY